MTRPVPQKKAQSDIQRNPQKNSPWVTHLPSKGLAGVAIGMTGLVLGLQGLGILQLLEWAVLDQWFRYRPHESHTLPIVLVTIDDADITAVGQWPFSDRQLAHFLTVLRNYEPAAIGLDLYRDLPIPPGTEELHQTFATTPNLIGIEKVVSESGSVAIAPHPTLESLEQVSFNDLVLDGDGHIRRHLISLRHDGQTKLALGTTLALLYLEQVFQVRPEALGNDRIRLGQAEFSPLRSNAGAYVNLEVGGYQILANYLRVPDGMPSVSMRAVLNRQVPPDQLAQKIVLVGMKAESSWGDRFYTPYSEHTDETWAGVELHANLAAQLITGALEGRSPLKPWTEPLEWSWILLWAALGVACNRKLSLNWQYWLRLPVLQGLLILSTYLLFLQNYWLPLISPFLACGGGWFATQGYLIWQKLHRDKQILEQTVHERTQALRHQNQALEQARVEAELANQAKSKFLAHISHELRTPLTAILGFGDLLERSIHLPHTEKDYAAIINRSGKHLLTLINDVLELSKIESGSVTLNPETIYLPSFLDDITQMFQAQATAKQVDLQLQITQPMPSWIDVDGGKLRQVIINLIGNAIKFTESGHVILHVRTDIDKADIDKANIDDADIDNVDIDKADIDDADIDNVDIDNARGLFHCSVDDTGPGLTPDEMAHLFQPFTQATAGKQLGRGTGLGLTLARQCIELMGGSIDVSSTVGQGSRFFFQIPIQVAAKNAEKMALSSTGLSGALSTEILSPGSSPPESSSRKSSERPSFIVDIPMDYRILIVDDDLNNQQLLTQWLHLSPCDIQTAETGAIALQIFQDWYPQLILLDIHLPDIDGYEVARRMRSQWALQPTTPSTRTWLDDSEPVILAITAGVLQDNYADLLAAGCDDVIWKPINVETLFSKISEYAL